MLAARNAGNEQYHDYLELAGEALAAAEWAFSDVSERESNFVSGESEGGSNRASEKV